MRRRTVAVTLTGLALAAAPASAAWVTTGGGSGSAQARALAGPGHITTTGTSASTATLAWGAAVAMPSGSIGYLVERAPFAATSGWVSACGSSPAAPVAGPSCTDTGLTAATDYQYRVTAVYAKWRQQGTPSGRVTTAAAPPPAAGTGSRLRFTACPDGVLSTFGRGQTFTSTVQVLNAQGVLVADNPSSLSLGVAVTGNGAEGTPSPSTLTVPPRSSVSSESVSISSTNGNNANSFTLTASSGGLTSATCRITK